ncbi:hypothetical protein ULF88_18840 [Halopseudomonas pachastrellae]|nr:hypothetical protein [Halopseudomonas pachastrellae]
MISISRRLTLSLVPLLLVSVLLIVQGGVWLYDRAQRDYLTQLLQREADSMLAALSRGSDGLFLDMDKVDPDYRRPYSGVISLCRGKRSGVHAHSGHRLPLPGDGLQTELLPARAGWSGAAGLVRRVPQGR